MCASCVYGNRGTNRERCCIMAPHALTGIYDVIIIRLFHKKLQLGLDVDPEVEAQAQVLFDQGMDLFKEGMLRPSFEK